MGRLKGTVSQLGASSSGQLAFLTLSLRGERTLALALALALALTFLTLSLRGAQLP